MLSRPTGEIEITDAIGKVKLPDSFISDLSVNHDNVAERSSGDRARWKIKNGSFNVLKTNGYNLAHRFGHDKQNLAAMFATLNLLAFAVNTICGIWPRTCGASRGTRPSQEYASSASWGGVTEFLIFQTSDELLATLAFTRPSPRPP
jgi:hypothetical protein